MKAKILGLIVVALLGFTIGAQAVDSLYIGPDGGDFWTVANWSAGIPNKVAPAVDGIIGDKTVNLSHAMLTIPEGARALTISNGTFNVKSGGHYYTRNGGIPALRVGVGTGNTGTMNVENGGATTHVGVSADVFIGEAGGGATGVVHISMGGQMSTAKALEILNGSLTFDAAANPSTKALADELVVDNNGTLAFQTDGAMGITIAGNTLAVELGSTSTLDMQLGGVYLVGDSWTIITGVSGFSGVVDGDGDGTFGNVINSLSPNDTFTVDYGVAVAGEVTVTLASSTGNSANELITSGAWATAGNWAVEVPSSTVEAVVNSNLTANLSAGSGNAQSLKVGTIANQSGTVSNGTLTVVNTTEIGTVTNSVGVVELTSYTAGTTNDVTSIGTGDDSSGSLVAGDGALTGSTLTVGSGLNGSGELDMGSGSATFDSVSVQNGTLDAASLTFNGLTIANHADTTGTVAVTSFTQSPAGGNISLGYGRSSLASFTGTGSIDAGVVAMGTSSNSTGTINIGTGSVTVGTQLRIANAQDSTGTLTAGTVTIADGKSITIATGKDSQATLSVTSITLPSTNGIFVGTGAGSSHNLSASDLSITGPIGDFGVGEGTGSSITGLLDTYNTYGALTVNTPLTINAMDHQITTLILNADLTMGAGTTGGLVDGGGISIASIADSNVTLDMADWVSGVVTSGPINVARGENAVGTMEGTDLVLDGALQVGGGGSGNNGTLTVDSLDSDIAGGRQVKIADGGTASTGTVTVAGNARIGDTWVGSGADAVGELTVGGSLTITNGLLYLADDAGAQGTVTVSGDSTINEIRVAAGVDSTGTLDLADLTTTVGGLKVAYNLGSTATATMDNLSGDRNLDISSNKANATGTVNVVENATISQLRMAIKNNSKATLTVGGTLDLLDGVDGSRYFNVASGDDCLVNISVGTLNKAKPNGLSVVKGGGDRSQAYVTANDGTLLASKFEVAAALEGTALFAVTNGTLSVGDYIRIGTGTSSDGTVLVDLSTHGTNVVSLGTASNAVGRLTMVGSGTAYASALNLGQTNSGTYGVGILTLAGGNMVVTGALEVATGSYINITDSSSSINWDGDFEALWNAGKLRSNGVTGPGNTFGSYFAVVDGVLIETPVGFIAIANAGGGVDISWNGQSGWNYDVKTNGNLMIPGGWGVYSTEAGIDGPMSVNVVAGDETFFQVIGRK